MTFHIMILQDVALISLIITVQFCHQFMDEKHFNQLLTNRILALQPPKLDKGMG